MELLVKETENNCLAALHHYVLYVVSDMSTENNTLAALHRYVLHVVSDMLTLGHIQLWIKHCGRKFNVLNQVKTCLQCVCVRE